MQNMYLDRASNRSSLAIGEVLFVCRTCVRQEYSRVGFNKIFIRRNRVFELWMVYLRYKDIDVNGTFYLRIFLLEIVLINFFF